MFTRRKLPKRRRGGKLIAQGSDTCVYDPAVACARPTVTTLANTEIQDPKKKTGYVTRIVKGPDDFQNQQDVYRMMLRIPASPARDEFLSHFIFAEYACDVPLIRSEELWSEKPCGYDELNTPGAKPGFQGMQTVRFDHSFQTGIKTLSNQVFLNECCEVIRCLLTMNLRLEIFHNDLHSGNMAVHRGKFIIHDWGRCFVGVRNMYQEVELTLQMPEYLAKIRSKRGYALYTAYTIMQDPNVFRRLWVVWDVLSFLMILELNNVLRPGTTMRLAVAIKKATQPDLVSQHMYATTGSQNDFPIEMRARLYNEITEEILGRLKKNLHPSFADTTFPMRDLGQPPNQPVYVPPSLGTPSPPTPIPIAPKYLLSSPSSL